MSSPVGKRIKVINKASVYFDEEGYILNDADAFHYVAKLDNRPLTKVSLHKNEVDFID